MAVVLSSVVEVARHLSTLGYEPMISGPRVAVRAQIDDFPAHVNAQFRTSKVMRVSLSLPVVVSEELRSSVAICIAGLNVGGQGGGFVMTRKNVAFVTQVPLEGGMNVAAEPLVRAIELCIERSRAELAGLRRAAATGMATT